MIHLDSQQTMASGSNRKCFIHPNDENLCIKVLHPDRHLKIQLREQRYYNCLIRRNISWKRLSKMAKPVQTDQGIGLVFEIIRDFDGQISKPLDYYLQLDDPKINQIIIEEIEILKSYLLKEAIVFRDLITLNILLQEVAPKKYKAVIIDGIGHNDFIPICNYSVKFSRKKIIRTWNRKKNHWFDKYPSIKDDVLFFNSDT